MPAIQATPPWRQANCPEGKVTRRPLKAAPTHQVSQPTQGRRQARQRPSDKDMPQQRRGDAQYSHPDENWPSLPRYTESDRPQSYSSGPWPHRPPTRPTRTQTVETNSPVDVTTGISTIPGVTTTGGTARLLTLTNKQNITGAPWGPTKHTSDPMSMPN